jgi:hypothetical protein
MMISSIYYIRKKDYDFNTGRAFSARELPSVAFVFGQPPVRKAPYR